MMRSLGLLALACVVGGCPPSKPVDAPTILSFKASDTSVLSGAEVTLTWSVADAIKIELSGVGDVSGKSSTTVMVKETTTFELTASNGSGTDVASLKVTVEERPSITLFAAEPASLPKGGGEVRLSWRQEGAKKLTIDHGVGDVRVFTSLRVRVTETTTFTLKASNDAGESEATTTVTVQVPDGPPKISFTADVTDLPMGGGFTTLRWNVADADTITLNPDVGTVWAVSSRYIEVRKTSTFELTAKNVRGETKASVTVRVYVPTERPKINTFAASSARLPAGGAQTTLSWSVSEADRLSIDNGVGQVTGTSKIVAVLETTTFTLTASNANGDTQKTTTVTVYVPEHAPTIQSFSASPASFDVRGGFTTLQWRATDAATFRIEPRVSMVSTTSAYVSVRENTTFTLVALNAAGESLPAQTTVTVRVPDAPPRVRAFSASSSTLPMGGGEVTLTWGVDDAASISIDNGVGEVSTDDGNLKVTVRNTTTFRLSATNARGTTHDTTVVTVNNPTLPPSITELRANPTAIKNGGDTIKLIWSVEQAQKVTIEPWLGTVAVNGERDVYVSSATTFRLTATNPAGQSSRTLDVAVLPSPPSISSFSALPAVVTRGGTVTLSWTTLGATSLSLNHAIGPVTGTSMQVQVNEPITYTLTATNAADSVSKSVAVQVKDDPTGDSLAEIQSFSASPSTLSQAGYTTLSWRVNGASTVALNEAIGPVSGTSLEVYARATTTYQLTATDRNGHSTWRTLTVVVGN